MTAKQCNWLAVRGHRSEDMKFIEGFCSFQCTCRLFWFFQVVQKQSFTTDCSVVGSSSSLPPTICCLRCTAAYAQVFYNTTHHTGQREVHWLFRRWRRPRPCVSSVGLFQACAVRRDDSPAPADTWTPGSRAAPASGHRILPSLPWSRTILRRPSCRLDPFDRYDACNLYIYAYTCTVWSVKWSNGIALCRKPTSKLWSITYHMESHSVTCHPTQVNVPCHNPSQTGRYLIYLPRRDGRLSWHLGACYITHPGTYHLIATWPAVKPMACWCQVQHVS